MAKIPVGKTIGHAYNFTFGHLGAIIALIWLPTVVIALLSFLPQVLGIPPAGQAIFMPNVSPEIRLWGLSATIVSMVFSTMTYQAVAELALGLRQPGANFYFSLAAPVWRLLGAILLFVLLLALFAGLFVGAVALTSALALAPLGKAATVTVAAIVMLAGLGFLWLAVFRLGFLIVPITVAEGRIDLARGWTLTYGNFWRMFTVALAIWLPLIVIFVMGLAVILGKDLSVFSALMTDTTPQAEAARTALLQRHIPALIGFNLIMTPFIMGLGVGGGCFAYRALMPSTDVFA